MNADLTVRWTVSRNQSDTPELGKAGQAVGIFDWVPPFSLFFALFFFAPLNGERRKGSAWGPLQSDNAAMLEGFDRPAPENNYGKLSTIRTTASSGEELICCDADFIPPVLHSGG